MSDKIKEAHKPNTGTVLVELYRLLAILLARKSFDELRKNASLRDAFTHLQQYGNDEITRILLVVAITARVIDDREKKVFDLVAGDCGNISETGKDKGLSLREACNKIIHAQKLRFDQTEPDDKEKLLNPVIFLSGYSSSGTEWNAKLDVIAFAKEYIDCVRHF